MYVHLHTFTSSVSIYSDKIFCFGFVSGSSRQMKKRKKEKKREKKKKKPCTDCQSKCRGNQEFKRGFISPPRQKEKPRRWPVAIHQSPRFGH